MKYTLSFRKLGKMSQNLSSAAVVIGALRVNKYFGNCGKLDKMLQSLTYIHCVVMDFIT